MSPSSESPETLKRLRELSEEIIQHAELLGLEQTAQIIQQDVARRIDKDGRIRIFVLGEVNHGKSTLINALLQRPLLPMGVTPTTGTVVSVRMGEQRGFFVPTAEGSKRLDAPEFEQAVKRSEYPQLELICGTELLPNTLELWDTPGLNDPAKFRESISRSELPRADVFLWVLDATQALTESEVRRMLEASEQLGGLESSGARLEVAINRIDLVPEDEQGLVFDRVRSILALHFNEPTQIFLTDARRALQTPDLTSRGTDGVALLRAHLSELASSRDKILPARTRGDLINRCRVLVYDCSLQSRALKLEEEELQEEIDAVEKALGRLQNSTSSLSREIRESSRKLFAESESRIEAFSTQLHAFALSQIDKSNHQQLTDTLPGALTHAFSDFIETESKRLAESLEEITRDALATYNELARRHLEESRLHLAFQSPDLYIDPPSLSTDLGLIALGVTGALVMYFGSTVPGLVMTIASPIGTFALREQALRKAREEAKSKLGEFIQSSAGQMGGHLRSALDTYVDELLDFLSVTDHNLGDELLATLRSAKRRGEEMQEGERNELQKKLGEAQKRLKSILGELEEMSIDTRFQAGERPSLLH